MDISVVQPWGSYSVSIIVYHIPIWFINTSLACNFFTRFVTLSLGLHIFRNCMFMHELRFRLQEKGKAL